MKVADLFETDDSRGQQILKFADYVNRLGEEAPDLRSAYKSVGSALFKAGFTYDDTQFHLLPDEGGVFEVNFPYFHKKDEVKKGIIYLQHYRWVRGEKYIYNKFFKIEQLEGMKPDQLVKMMRQQAISDR